MKKHRREYCVTYIDDSEERREAVEFFGDGLFPAMNIPDKLDRMRARKAQEYLDAHPIEQQWSMLTLDHLATFEDDDLHRLKHLPELPRLHSHVNHLSDQGVSLIPEIPNLQHLLIYSPIVTDRCLEDIAKLRQLETIDLQGSHLITRKAFDSLVADLPNLVDIYPPFHRPLSEVYAEAQQAQNKRMESNG